MPGSAGYTREELAAAVAGSRNWAEVMRALGLRISGGRRRTVQRDAAELGLATGHFVFGSPRRRYTDDAIARAVASSTTLREVVCKLGARPATGTLSHIRRRVRAAGIDVGHLAALNRPRYELPFSVDELSTAAASVRSLRALACALDVPDDGRSRAALRRMLHECAVDITHFSFARVAIPETPLRAAVARSTSFSGVLRELGLPVEEVNRRRVQRRATELGLDTAHFERRTRRTVRVASSRAIATEVLRVRPEGSPRTSHERLRRALGEIGVAYACQGCGNTGEWKGKPLTLQIDHIDGDWRDNRRHNLRYLCPNCHATTPTWCGRNRRRTKRPEGPARR